MNKTIIIAEAGVNHNGNMEMAKRLIDEAANAGVDYVKFQTFSADKIASKNAPKAEYQEQNLDEEVSQYEMLKNLELSEQDHSELINYCEQKNVRFFSTAFDLDSLQYIASLGFQMIKIPSGEITNFPYLKAVARLGKPVILSTGMSSIEEVDEAVEVLVDNGSSKDEITVLHCNTQYPTPMEDVNLAAMNTIGKTLGVAIGYSDHTLGIEVPIAAVALGAKVIEKHFTLDRNLPGPDHKASLEPSELQAMVNAIRNIEKAMAGDGLKKPSKSETANIAVARKSIHINKALIAGSELTELDLIALRPGDGISPMAWMEVIGKKLKNDMAKMAKLNWEDIL